MSHRHLMGRRQFLIVSSTFAAAAATVGPKLLAIGTTSPKRLSVGFASFDEQAAVSSASSIPAGDGGFIGRGVRVVVSGASGASTEPRARRAVELLAHFPYDDGTERLSAPFRAWGGSRLTGCQGNSVGFNMPIDDGQRITFTVGAETGAPAGAATRRDALIADVTESTALPLTLSVRNEDGALKLVRGFYVVVPMFDGDSEPRWSNWTIRAVEGRRSLVDDQGASAPFEHLVLRVDYATL